LKMVIFHELMLNCIPSVRQLAAPWFPPDFLKEGGFPRKLSNLLIPQKGIITSADGEYESLFWISFISANSRISFMSSLLMTTMWRILPAAPIRPMLSICPGYIPAAINAAPPFGSPGEDAKPFVPPNPSI
jgi:hypothetical protein